MSSLQLDYCHGFTALHWSCRGLNKLDVEPLGVVTDLKICLTQNEIHSPPNAKSSSSLLLLPHSTSIPESRLTLPGKGQLEKHQEEDNRIGVLESRQSKETTRSARFYPLFAPWIPCKSKAWLKWQNVTRKAEVEEEYGYTVLQWNKSILLQKVFYDLFSRFV